MSYNVEELCGFTFAPADRVSRLECNEAELLPKIESCITHEDHSMLVRACEEAFGRIAFLQEQIDSLHDYIEQIEPYIPEIPDPADIL